MKAKREVDFHLTTIAPAQDTIFPTQGIIGDSEQKLVRILDPTCVKNSWRSGLSNWAELKKKFDKTWHGKYNRYEWFDGLKAWIL